jgi:hypothetical protein
VLHMGSLDKSELRYFVTVGQQQVL